MFTGIITDIGEVQSVEKAGDTRFRICTGYDVSGVVLGASIACDGACLTVVETGEDAGRGWFDVQASAETLSKTRLGDWAPGTPINLERALKVGDELGGHIVSGHVDGVGSVTSTAMEGESKRIMIEAPASLARFIAPKGSVTVNGVSLTVNEVDGVRFGVNIIPHTQTETTLGALAAGDAVNLEIDVLARYVARLAEAG